MIETRIKIGIALAASVILTAGCGGTTPEVDNAEIVRPDPKANPEPGATAPVNPPDKATPKE